MLTRPTMFQFVTRSARKSCMVFLFYHVFRERKITKGRKRAEYVAFDPDEYVRVISLYYGYLSGLEEGVVGESLVCINEKVPDPLNPLGYDQINTYRSAVKSYYTAQWEMGANRLAWTEINSSSVHKLRSIVKGRKKRIKKKRTLRQLKLRPVPSIPTPRSEKSNSRFGFKGVLPVPQ